MLKRLTQEERWQIKGAQYGWLAKKAKAADTPKPLEPVRKLGKGRRTHLINTVIDVLAHGKPTHFAFEGSCHFGLRSGLCLEGWPWNDADHAAKDIVAAALKRMGATRPTWWQGQPDSAAEGLVFVERTYCECCRSKMPKAAAVQTGWAKRFCSKLCNEHARNRYRRSYGQQRTTAELHMAQKAMGERKRQLREKICVQCSEFYVPDQSSMGLYCSRTCAGLGNRGRRVPLPKCVTCGKECKQTRTKYCSKACFRATIARDEKSCEVCSRTFYPPDNGTKTCSRECRYKLPNLGRRRLVCEAT